MKALLIYFVATFCVLWCSGFPSVEWTNVGTNVIDENAFGPSAGINGTSTRIIGGSEVAPNSVPYMVAIRPSASGFCGASFIAPNWVLTAAHCVINYSSTKVVLGAHHILQSEATQVVVNSSDIIVHPEFDPSRYLNDIALIRLQESVVASNIIRPIRIAPPNAGSFAEEWAYLTGWGYTADDNPVIASGLKGVRLRVMSTEECRKYAGSFAYETNVCTNGFNGIENVGACSGDSGSPLVVDGLQIGVASFGAPKCAGGNITSFARVSVYANWINQTIFA